MNTDSKTKGRHKDSILKRLLVPTMVILLVQLSLLTALVFAFILPEVKENSYKILESLVKNRATYLETEMAGRWSRLEQARQNILGEISTILSSANRRPSDLNADPGLAKMAIEKTASEIVNLLRRNSVTGAFIIFNSPSAADSDPSVFPGFYVRNLNPSFFLDNNRDLLLLKGPEELSLHYNLARDMYWTAEFELPELDPGAFPGEPNACQDKRSRFFYAPLREAEKSPFSAPEDLSYWSPAFSVRGDQREIITYSQPLVHQDGTILAVFGIDIAINHLRGLLRYEELGTPNSIYTLALEETKSKQFEQVCLNAKAHKDRFSNLSFQQGWALEDSKLYGFRENGKDYFGSIQPIKLYTPVNPFYDQTWVLMGIQNRADILALYLRIEYLIIIIAIICLTLGSFSASLASRIIAKPISAVVKELEKIDPGSRIKLKKTNIKEVDRLTQAIEEKSREVAESASRLSKILELSQIPVAVFEYNKKGKQVACSANLPGILCWNDQDANTRLMEKDFFLARFRELEPFIHSKDGDAVIYKLPAEDGTRWIRVSTLTEGDAVLGTVIENTKEMEEKSRIEYDRDYDSLTGIYNRRAFQVHLDSLLTDPESLGIASLIMCDLDNLKHINDTYGHETGDEYIKAFAGLLKEFEQHQGIISRRSGDEFNVFLYGHETQESLRSVIFSVWEKLDSVTIRLPSGETHPVRASAGFAWYPLDAVKIQELVRYADFAMYSIKNKLKGNVQEFDVVEYKNSMLLQHHGQDVLNRLLEDQEVTFAFQPILNVKDLSIYGYEMLMRSPLPDLGSPGEILRLVESQSKIHLLDHLTCFKGMKTFIEKSSGQKPGQPRKIFLSTFGSGILEDQDLSRFLAEYRDYLPHVVLEVAGAGNLQDSETREKIADIRAAGGMIAQGGFGVSGKDSAFLDAAAVRPDVAKIDMSLVRNIHLDKNKQNIFKQIVLSAEKRDIRVLAEGIESPEELVCVMTLGADLLQGFYIGRPSFDMQPVKEELIKKIKSAGSR